MTQDTDFDRLWNDALRRPLYDDPTQPCVYAQTFRSWADDLCSGVRRNATDVSIDLATLLLTRRYFEWYRTVPPEHRAVPDDHSCIFQVFREAYEQLWAMHLTAAPPSFELPKPPPPPREPQMVQLLLVPPREDD